MAHELPPLNCPYCEMPMRYQWSQDDRHVYRCPRHGLIVLQRDGHLGRDTPDDPVIRH
jgi:hypothetical protein